MKHNEVHEAVPVDEASTTVTVVENQGGALAANDLLAMYQADAGDVVEYSGTEVAQPFLTILQANSPQVIEGDARFVEGAKAGLIMNTVSKQLFDQRVLMGKPEPGGIPVLFGDKCNKVMVEWVPRNNGGGLAGQHAPNSAEAQSARPDPDPEHKNRLLMPNGNNLVETDYHYPLVVDLENPFWATIGMSSTQLKVSRELNGFIKDYRKVLPNGVKTKVPPYAMIFLLRTKLETRKDKTFWGWDIRFIGTVDEFFTDGAVGMSVYAAGQKYNKALKGGIARNVKPPVEDEVDVPF